MKSIKNKITAPKKFRININSAGPEKSKATFIKGILAPHIIDNIKRPIIETNLLFFIGK